MGVYCSQGCSQKQSINAQLTLLKCEKWKAVDLHLWYALNCSRNRCCSTLFWEPPPCHPLQIAERTNDLRTVFFSKYLHVYVTDFTVDPNTLLPTADKWSENTNVHKWTVNLSDFQNTPTWAWKGKWIFSISPIELVFLLFVTLATGC